MATFPPSYSPRDARRQARAAERMQRDQYRAQYAFMRRRPSFVGPLLLVATGVIALLLETGKIQASSFWPWYAEWWPALLILIGLGLLAEYFVDRGNPMAGRRSVGGIIWLIILLSVTGGASHAANNFHGTPWSDTFGDHERWFSMMGDEHTKDVTLAERMSATGTLTIENARGDVDVSPLTSSDDAPSEVRVAAHQSVHANSDDAARNDFEAVKPTLVTHGNDASLSVPSRDGASVDLKVTVPEGIALVLRTAHGSVAVSGIKRNVDINATHTDVTVDNVGGAVHLQMDKGDIVAHDLAGDLTIDGRADDVSVSGVKGRSMLNGDFFGDTRVERAGSLVHFHSSRTDLDVPKLTGEMTLDSGNLRLAGASGGIRLTTRSKDVEVTDLVGDAHIEDSNGDVNVSTGLPLGNLQLTDRTGSMTVTVPSNAAFSVHASVNESDELNTDFALTNENTSGRKTLTGQVGQGGPHIELETGHGDLALRRGGVHVAQIVVPEVNVPGVRIPRIVIPPINIPAVPAVPAAPGAPVAPRHLHSKTGEPQPTVQ